jgi:hypothetical protein
MNIGASFYKEFLASQDTFRVYKDNQLVFASQKDRLMPPVEYLGKFASHADDVVVFDRIIGNAAALLLILTSCREVFSPLGSEMAIRTLNPAGIKYHFDKTVDFIRDKSGMDMCPMEKLSLNKNPEEFYRALKERMQGKSTTGKK